MQTDPNQPPAEGMPGNNRANPAASDVPNHLTMTYDRMRHRSNIRLQFLLIAARGKGHVVEPDDFEEAERFVNAVERWEAKDVEQMRQEEAKLCDSMRESLKAAYPLPGSNGKGAGL